MNDVMSTLSQLGNIQGLLIAEINRTLKENKINISGEDLLLLYEIHRSDTALSPSTLAQKSQKIIQQIIFQLKSLESRNLLILEENSMDITEQNIILTNPEKLAQVFKTINQNIINKVKKNIENSLLMLARVS